MGSKAIIVGFENRLFTDVLQRYLIQDLGLETQVLDHYKSPADLAHHSNQGKVSVVLISLKHDDIPLVCHTLLDGDPLRIVIGLHEASASEQGGQRLKTMQITTFRSDDSTATLTRGIKSVIEQSFETPVTSSQ